METRAIGSLNVTVVGLGCNNFGRRLDEQGTKAVIDAALDAGINFFDTADVYGDTQSETFIGRILGSRRKDVIIATKFGHKTQAGRGGAHPDYIRTAAEDSLRRLNTDVIDLYQIHTPDPEVPIADTLGALNALVQAGKVREIGCSNFSAEQLRDADAAVQGGGARFVSVQNEYSLLHREPEDAVLAECERLGLGFLPYFPLGSGLLTGKYRQGQPPPQGTRLSDREPDEAKLTQVEQLIGFAESKGHTILELAFAWLLARPVVSSVIAGATKPEQIRANVAAAEWQLTSDDMREIDALLVGMGSS
jgi:aryl-alcohol dehydrogenase-like predicted oxidoreductase